MKAIELMRPGLWRACNDEVARRLVLAESLSNPSPTRVSIVDGRASSYGLEDLISDVAERGILIDWCLQELAKRS